MISGILTAVLMTAFLAIVGWAWSSQNRAKFEQAAQVPLNDEHARPGETPACCSSRENRA